MLSNLLLLLPVTDEMLWGNIKHRTKNLDKTPFCCVEAVITCTAEQSTADSIWIHTFRPVTHLYAHTLTHILYTRTPGIQQNRALFEAYAHAWFPHEYIMPTCLWEVIGQGVKSFWEAEALFIHSTCRVITMSSCVIVTICFSTYGHSKLPLPAVKLIHSLSPFHFACVLFSLPMACLYQVIVLR